MTEFAQKYGPWAVIAGASEGIGASLADQLASRGLDLVLIARNGALLEQVRRVCASDTACRRERLSKTSPIRMWARGWPMRPTASTSAY